MKKKPTPKSKRPATIPPSGWTKVVPHSMREFPNAAWTRELGGGLRAVLETLVPIGMKVQGTDGPFDLSEHSKVVVWIMDGDTRSTIPFPHGPYWSASEAKREVDMRFMGARGGKRRSAPKARKVATSSVRLERVKRLARGL